MCTTNVVDERVGGGHGLVPDLLHLAREGGYLGLHPATARAHLHVATRRRYLRARVELHGRTALTLQIKFDHTARRRKQ